MTGSMRLMVGVGVFAASLALGGCSFMVDGEAPTPVSSPAEATVRSSDVIDTVEHDFTEQGRMTELDCGAEDFSEGESRTCVITDVATGLQYETVVKLFGIEGPDFKFELSISRAALNSKEEDPSVDYWTDSLVVTGPELAASAESLLADDIDHPYEIACDEPEYQMTMDTRITCTYSDEFGEKLAYIEVTALKGSQCKISVTLS